MHTHDILIWNRHELKSWQRVPWISTLYARKKKCVVGRWGKG